MGKPIIEHVNGYFSDGHRKIHYVLVLKEHYLSKIQTVIENIKAYGIEVEIAKGQKLFYLTFVLLHLPKRAQDDLSKVYQVGSTTIFANYENEDIFKYFHFKKLPKLPDVPTNRELTNSQCIIIIHKILETITFGIEMYDYGIKKLIHKGLVNDAYPLHDGSLSLYGRDYDENEMKTENDRQILHRYWANFHVWRYELPLDLIKKYYGYEIAFYFHCMEYFTLMLFPLAAIGTLILIINIFLIHTFEFYSTKEICDSNIHLCPNCILKLFCFYQMLRDFCELYTWSYIVDNHLTVFFAILTSIWATLFVNIWLRRTSELKLRWGIRHDDYEDSSIRNQFVERARRRTESMTTGITSPFLNPLRRAIRYTFIVIVCLLYVGFDILMIFAIFYFEVVIKMYIVLSAITFTKGEKRGLKLIASSFILVVVVKIKSATIPVFARWLTQVEMHATQKTFDSSLVFKRYLLSFSNNYTVLLYTVFFKGAFKPPPNAPQRDYLILTDSCEPFACAIDLAIQVFFIMLFRRLLWNILRLIFLHIRNLIKYVGGIQQFRDLPQFELEYLMEPTSRDMLYSDFNEMVIEYGMVTFFGAVFPLAPLFALIDNILEMRLSAERLIKRVRRPIPRIVKGIGPWQGILLALMYLSTAINAFVISFTTRFISREVYRFQNNFGLKGFINHTLSPFATNDSEVYTGLDDSVETCYYIGMREPPESENKYKLSTHFWRDFTLKMIFLISFEHIVIVLNALLFFLIRNVPPIVRDYMAYTKDMRRERRTIMPKEREQTLFFRFRGRSGA